MFAGLHNLDGKPTYGQCRYGLRNQDDSEATDARGRAVQLGNTTPLGMGLQGRYRATGAAYDGADCWVRGVACRAEEDRFGGVVIQTYAA